MSQVLFNEDDSKLIAVAKGHPGAPGFLAVWDVNADGSLSENFTKLAPPAGAALLFGTSVIPGMNALLVTDPAVGAEIIDLSGLSGNTTLSGGSRSSLVNITGEGAVCWTAYSSKTGNFYATDIRTSLVTEINVDKNLKGTVVKVRRSYAGHLLVASEHDAGTL